MCPWCGKPVLYDGKTADAKLWHFMCLAERQQQIDKFMIISSSLFRGQERPKETP